MTRLEKVKFVAVRTIGNFLVLFSLYGVVATFGPALSTEAKYRIGQMRGVTYVLSDEVEASFSLTPTPIQDDAKDPESPTLSSVLTGPRKQVLVPKDTNFSIVIPKIGASSKIIPNVNPLNENEFLPVLQSSIAHAKGTVFPGIPGNVYLFAHSTDNFWNVGRYNAVFYLLKDLEVNDEVIVFFEGKKYIYDVTEKKVVSPEEVSHLVDSHGGPEQLILQTCWPPGTTWQRLLVVAQPRKK